MFYHPKTKRVITAADGYKFDVRLPSGPQFNEKFDGDFYISQCSENPIHQAPAHKTNDVCYVKQGDNYEKGTILTIPFDDEQDPYHVQLDNSTILEVMSSRIHKSNPSVTPSDKEEPVNHIYMTGFNINTKSL